LLFGQILGRDPDPYAFWHSSQSNDPGLNLALYSNKEVDELLEDARQTSNYEEREEKYIEFQQLLSEDVPAVFLYSLQYTYITPKNLKGITTQRINHPSDRFSNINSWFIKTKKSFNFFNFN
jgi:peptide/nickel transport system substrate-binding protein